MLRISLSYFCNLGARLDALNKIEAGKKISDVNWMLMTAENELTGLLNFTDFLYAIKASRQPGTVLLQAIKKLTTTADKERVLDFMDVWSITHNYSNFLTVLQAELQVADAYYVMKKRGYDTFDLIDHAQVLFPDELGVKVPEAISDIKQAGKCIAFELPTAAGFHLHRANESVLHKYYDAVTNNAKRPDTRNIGGYINELNSLKRGDAKVLSALKDLKDLHRNPLIHPEDSFEDVDEAMALMGSILAVMVHMLKVIPAPT